MSTKPLLAVLRDGGARVQQIQPTDALVDELHLSDPLPAQAAARLLRRVRAERQADSGPLSAVAMPQDAVSAWRENVARGAMQWVPAAVEVTLRQPVDAAAAAFFSDRQQVLRGFHESYRRDLRRQMAELEQLREAPPPGSKSEGWDWQRSDQEVHLVLLSCEPGLVPLYMGFGGFARCPLPVEHALVHRCWHQRYDAEVVYLDRRSLELSVQRPPDSAQEVRQAAWEYFLYSNLELRQSPSLAALAVDRCLHHWTCRWGDDARPGT